MDVLDRVREIGADVELTEAQLAGASHRLREELREGPARSRRSRRIGIGVLGGALAAAAAATAIVVATLSPPARVVEAASPSPSVPAVGVTRAPSDATTAPAETAPAVAVLEQAADLAQLASPQLQPGQYLRVQSRLEYIVTYDAEAVEGAPYGLSRANADAGWLVTSSYDTYIPADRSDEWVRVLNPDIAVVDWYGPGAEAFAAEWMRQVYRAEPIVERIQGGLIEPYETGYTIGSPEYYAAMPRDPQELLDWYADYHGLADEKERAAESLAQVIIFDLEINAAPADLRSSMFRALSLIEGVSVKSADGGVTTLSIDVAPDGSRRVTLSIDMQTGLVVASDVTSGPGGGIIPDEVADHRVNTITEVVDSAP